MKFINTYFVDVLKKHYIDFSGRATRKQFWLFVLIALIITAVLNFILSFFGSLGSAVNLLFQIALFVPFLAIMARRLRDGGHSIWWLLLALTIWLMTGDFALAWGFIPLVCIIVLLVMLVHRSK